MRYLISTPSLLVSIWISLARRLSASSKVVLSSLMIGLRSSEMVSTERTSSPRSVSLTNCSRKSSETSRRTRLAPSPDLMNDAIADSVATAIRNGRPSSSSRSSNLSMSVGSETAISKYSAVDCNGTKRKRKMASEGRLLSNSSSFLKFAKSAYSRPNCSASERARFSSLMKPSAIQISPKR